jgi:hypothetical protein
MLLVDLSWAQHERIKSQRTPYIVFYIPQYPLDRKSIRECYPQQVPSKRGGRMSHDNFYWGWGGGEGLPVSLCYELPSSNVKRTPSCFFHAMILLNKGPTTNKVLSLKLERVTLTRRTNLNEEPIVGINP